MPSRKRPEASTKTSPARARNSGARAPARTGATTAPRNARRTAAKLHRPDDVPIVVVGASAGGLDAMKKLLGAVPAEAGLSFVMVPHLDPRHQSLMVELLAKHASMPVHEAAHRDRIQPGHAYVIPPNKYLAIKHGAIELSAPSSMHDLPTAIDRALSSAALDLGDAAIGIVLSGTGNYGVLGITDVKAAGGLVLVQDPATAEFDQMPRNALATGLADYTLPPEEMPQVLVRYASRRRTTRAAEGKLSDRELDSVQAMLALIQARTKHDFRHYRKSTIVRRIERRMALLAIDDWDAYVKVLRDDADEVIAFFLDLLIGVTAFFRDREAFAALAKDVIPQLVARADPDTPVRVWVPGCATGEEAYSIAMLLFEQFRAADKVDCMQIFATDIDERALETARRGIYPDTIAAAVSPERLKRFFIKIDPRHYQVSKQLRDSVAFAPQNLISDPPFSRLDLISCRNVLIYLEPEVQEKVLSLLHFSLAEGGYLLLGPAGSIGRASEMFEPVSQKWRLYRRSGPAPRDLVGGPIAAGSGRRAGAPTPWATRRPATDLPQLMQKLLADEFAPASVLITSDYEIVLLHGPVVNYLEFRPGEPTKNLLEMARQGLRAQIRAVCRQAAQNRRTVRDADARVRRNGGYVHCTVTARPVSEPKEAAGLLLVVFQDVVAEPSRTDDALALADGQRLAEQLEKELRATREDLRSTIEDLEASNEELKASNEEILSMNEELQSTNEELETSKEELQSMNEELATVNSQLRDKVEDLDAVNSDLTNLMSATGVPTVFLDHELKIKRFTPSLAQLWNFVPADVGRPFADLKLRFRDDTLLQDAERVLSTLATSEKEVPTDDGRWFLRRILPYRASGGRIGGLVITLLDITNRVTAEARARRLATVLLESNDAVTVCDLDGRITTWNDGAELLFGYAAAKALTMNVRELVPAELQPPLADVFGRIKRGESFSFETQRVTSRGDVIDVWLTATPLRDESGTVIAMATTERDVTARHRAEETIRALNATLEQRIAERTAALEASEQRIRSVLDTATDAIVTIDVGGTIQTFNKGAEAMFGYSAGEAIGQDVSLLMDPPHREKHDAYLRRYRETREPRLIGKTRELRARRKNGEEFPIQLSVTEVPGLGLYTGIIRDVTEQRALQEEIVRIATLEQRRIGEELHDNTQQELTGLGLLAQTLSDSLLRDGGEDAAIASKLAAGIAETHRRLRAVAKGLIPVPVDREGLMVALGDLTRRTEQEHGIECRFVCPKPVKVADDTAALHLFRIAQEAVTNAVKHADASAISVDLHADDRQLRLEIRDDGIGIDRERLHSDGLGLRIMEHRCGLLGGLFTVRPREAGGTTVACVIPTPEGAG